MSESQVLEFLIRAQSQANAAFDQARKNIKDVVESAKELSIGFTDLRSAGLIVGDVLQTLNTIHEATVGRLKEFAEQTEDLQRLIGGEVEEVSTLIEVGKLAGVSYGEMEGAMQAAIRKGISPTIDGLKEIADKYVAIQDPVAKSKFLMDSFGRSGAVLGELLEGGSAGINNMAGEVKSLNAELTPEVMSKVEKLIELERRRDLQKEAFMRNIGEPVAGFEAGFWEAMNNALFGAEKMNQTLDEQSKQILIASTSWEDYIIKVDQAQKETVGLAITQANQSNPLEVLAKSYQALTHSVPMVTRAEYDYMKQIEATTDAINKAHAAANAYFDDLFSKTSRGKLSDRAGYGNYYTGSYNTGEPGRAGGGPMWAGVTRWVGENGPEPFTPNMDGWIGTPPGGGGGSVQINLSFPSMFPPSNPEQLVQVLRPAAEQVVREMKRNGQI